MKKQYLSYLSAIIAAAVLTGCSSDDEGSKEKDDKSVKTETVSFHVTTDESNFESGNIWSFQRGDNFGIFAIEQKENANLQEKGNYANNVCYQWDGNNFTPMSHPISKTYDSYLAYYAFYPYSASAGPHMEYTVSCSQISSEAVSKSDFCTAFTPPTQAMSISLTLKHRMSRLCVKVTDTDLKGQVSKVTLKGVWLTLSADLIADSYTATTSHQGEITMWRATEDGNTFYAVLPPQILYATNKYLVATVNGTEMNVDFDEDNLLTSGNEKVLTIFRRPTPASGLVALGGQIHPWEGD